MAALVLALAGCDTVGQQAESPAGAARPQQSGSEVTHTASTNGPTTSTTIAPEPEVTFNPPAGAANVRPDTPISVAVSGGRLTSLTIASAGGPVEGMFNGGNFAPAHALAFGESYTITATVVTGGSGDLTTSTTAASTTTSVPTARKVPATGAMARTASSSRITSFTRIASFTTLPTPAKTGSVDVAPEEGATVGAGMPIIVDFPSSVPEAAKAAVARWFTVTSTPAVEGAWRWVSDTEMHWRPRYYWPGRVAVTVTGDLAGRAIDDTWFTNSTVRQFKIGESHRITIDAATHQMVAYENGQALRSMPISTGRDAYPTASGTDLIMAKHDIFEMDSTSVGITGKDAYLVTVRNAQRLTNSGTFLHAAPWNGVLGSANISHGCVNASNADAAWMMDFTLIGDPVEISNTSEQVHPYNGWGDWNIPFDQWPNSA